MNTAASNLARPGAASREKANKGGKPARRASRLTPGGFRWILPGLVISVGLIYYSILYSGFLSFFDWGGGRQRMVPVGIDNYLEAFADPVFWTSLRNTLLYFTIVFAVQVVGGVLFAAVMHSKIWLGNLYKIIIVIPVVVAPATLAPAHIEVWQTAGVFNEILTTLGLGGVTQSWLGQSTTSIWVIILVGCWGSIGFGFILYFAGMAQIEPEMIEAARMDGASNLRMLFSIVVPNLKAVTVSLAILNAISALRLFDNVWLLTQGGPVNSSAFLGTMIYSEIVGSNRNLGYASALSMILLVLAITAAIIIQMRSKERIKKDSEVATDV